MRGVRVLSDAPGSLVPPVGGELRLPITSCLSNGSSYSSRAFSVRGWPNPHIRPTCRSAVVPDREDAARGTGMFHRRQSARYTTRSRRIALCLLGQLGMGGQL